MANDPIYGKPILDVSQAGKEQTIAEFLATVARGAGGVHEVTATTGTEVLTPEEAENGLIRATGTLVANLLIQFPAEHIAGHRIISNETSGAFDLEVEFDGGASPVTIAQGEAAIFIDGAIIPMGGGGSVVGFSIAIDGGGSELADNAQSIPVEVPYSMTLMKVTAYADTTGDVEVDVYNDTYANYPADGSDSIVGAAPVTISSGIKSQDSTLSGWTTALTAGSHLILHVNSCTDITRLVVAFVGIKN